MRVLLTGVAGFAGRHLATLLVADGQEVWGLTRAAPVDLPGVTPVVADLADEAATRRAVLDTAPAVIYHLAAASSPAQSVRDPVGTLRDNLLGTAALLQAALACRPRPRVLLVTTSEVYGAPRTTAPLTEDAPCDPLHPYAVSKLAVHHLGRQYCRTAGLDVIEARPFNHFGPGQRQGFVVPDFAAQVAAVAAGRQEPLLRVGDLSAAKDFTDVRDIVRGYRDLAEQGEPGVAYHLCSGRATSVGWILHTLARLAGVTIRTAPHPERLRPEPTPIVCGSFERARQAVGWRPRIGLETSLADVLAEWRERAAEPGGQAR